MAAFNIFFRSRFVVLFDRRAAMACSIRLCSAALAAAQPVVTNSCNASNIVMVSLTARIVAIKTDAVDCRKYEADVLIQTFSGRVFPNFNESFNRPTDQVRNLPIAD